MSFIQSILQVQWQQYNPGTDYFGGGGGGYYQQTDLTVNSLLATNNVLLVGAYFNNTLSGYYFTMVNVSNTTGGGGGVYFNIPWNGVGNYPVVSVTSSPTLEYVYINYPDTYEPSEYLTSPINITSLTFDSLTGNCGTNNAAIDLNGNPICFNNICINNIIDSKAFMSYAIGGESSTTNQSNIYFCNSLPYSTPSYSSNQGMSLQYGINNFNLVSSSWQNITNYVVNCNTSSSFTYFESSPNVDNSGWYPNFTSITTTQSGTMIVVSANDDTYGGIYCLQNNALYEFTPNTQTNSKWQMNGVIGIKFPLSSTYSTNWTTTTFQSIMSTELQGQLNGNFQNYIIGIQDTTLLKIAFNVPTAYSNLICDCNYITPNINGDTIVGPIVSLVSNIDAQNVVAFITPTQLFVSNDTGNNFYYIDNIPASNYYSSLAITIIEDDDPPPPPPPSSNSQPPTVIFLGTTNGSVYQITLTEQ